ncbi:TPA: DUF2523 domain-containing protein [Vibrio cholerae]|uniref:VSK receptor n=3 Tax=Fibrovirus TaxID=1977139 RepID=Q8W6D1_9VIRU|nr:DUF2523 family protein [Vibrio cholerae]NP_542360.1 VSK receptor [Vibrio phage VSK]YP_010083958.1 putative minor capsid protein [Vibrio phage ND1-fs1]AAL49742.1 VSK receptor [Vibrio phage VSK]EGR0774344.1 DUF2523 domain-containing protein [Vibrio cholerae]EGR0777374.1 DUF2523 domain-containing protein [Vibrio cholerae]EGR0781593.1 DUF2523 domain-containing protein [Vibrio cholerae]EGR0823744.1 DUF2523 domain-containing protein [Vibrio cholerae]
MDWVIDLFNKLIEFLYRLLITLIDMLKDVFLWLIDGVLSAVNLLLEKALSLIEPMDVSSYLTGIPSGAAWVISAIGIPQCLGMIMSAIIVRILLQLVPFTRLGS